MRHHWFPGKWLAICGLLALLLPLLVSPMFVVRAAAVLTGFNDANYVTGLNAPTTMAFAPDGRMFVSEQTGTLRVIKNGALLATPFLSLTVNSSGERGLLGIAFDPNFASNNFVYVYYTINTAPIHNRLSRFTANGDVAFAGSEVPLLDLDNLSSATNHNGGSIHFGPDGKVYIAVGENANSANAQTLGNLLGKMLRLNSDGTIPTDNPFYGTATGKNRAIWTYGHRNPFTFDFQPGTGRMFINDVGQSTWEEINDGIAGSNYGWPTCEGFCSPTNPSFRDPLYNYNHSTGSPTGCAITGGTFYNPTTVQFPASYVGKYFFADFCSGWIYYLDPASPSIVTQFATGIDSPVDLKVGSDGSLYYLQRGTGTVGKITYPAGQMPPVIVQPPTDQTVGVGQTATFSVSANGTPLLSYQWQRNSVNIPGATAATYTTPATTLSDNGALYRCIVTNSFNPPATSSAATLTVINRQPPVVTITQPINGTLYNGGQGFTYAGTATDAVEGTLPAANFSWTIVFHHDTHTHPFLGPINGVKTGTFTIPTTGETSANVWYRIHLTVTNSAGLSNTTFVDVNPHKVNLTLQTNPAGLQVNLDGQPQTAPYTFQGVTGILRNLNVVSPQTANGKLWTFTNWSDGGASGHDITTPSSDTTYTANFQGSSPIDTIGVYHPSTNTFFLKNSNSGGAADTTVKVGDANSHPVVGDWDGDGFDTVGIYNRKLGVFFLYDSNVQGAAATRIFVFGNPNDIPISGKWVSGTPADNVGRPHDGVGVYRSSNGLIYLASTWPAQNSNIFSDYVIVLGNPGWAGFAGRWNGGSLDTAGVYDPTNARFYLTNQSCNGILPGPDVQCVQFSDSDTFFGPPNGIALKGDWIGQGKDGIGIFNPQSGVFLLKNNPPTTSGSTSQPDAVIVFGNPGDIPLAGHWKTGSTAPRASVLVPPTAAPIVPTPGQDGRFD